jgi:hypothetical protein
MWNLDGSAFDMTTKDLTRNDFLRLGTGLIGLCSLPFGLGCPADDGNDEGGESGADGNTADDATTAAMGCAMDPSVTIGTNHGHELVIPLADVEAHSNATYDIQGASPHAHSVTLTADDFAALDQGMSVMVVSTLGDGHTHQVTVSC